MIRLLIVSSFSLPNSIQLYRLFIHLGTLSCFQLGTIMNRAVDKHSCTFLYKYMLSFLYSNYLGLGLLAYTLTVQSSLQQNVNLFSRMPSSFFISISTLWELAVAPQTCQHFFFSLLFILVTLIDLQWYLMLPLVYGYYDFLFVCLFAINIFFSVFVSTLLEFQLAHRQFLSHFNYKWKVVFLSIELKSDSQYPPINFSLVTSN